MSNPLLDSFDLAPFSQIKTEHIVPAVESTLKAQKSAIETLLSEQNEYRWDNLMLPLDELGNELGKRWSPVSHMNAVVNSDELRAAYDQCLPLLSEHSTWLGQNKPLYQAIEQLYEHRDSLDLDTTQIKILEDELRDFKLAGVALPLEKQQRFGEIRKRLSELSSKYEQNLLDATMAWSKHLEDDQRLSGLPASSLALLEQNAQQKELSGYLLNLEFPCYFAVMTYADDQALREEMYRAYSTRASDQSEHSEWDNSPLMDEMLALKHELAQLLDFAHYGELSLATKMASSTEEVMSFLQDLAAKSKPQAEKELAELTQYAQQELKTAELNAWDVLYTSEKLKQACYAISQEELRPYFPVNQVLDGLFSITETLFEVKIKEIESGFDKWHEDVRLFEVQSSDGESIARFYLDLFARSFKRGGAWMADYCSRFRFANDELQRPVAYLTCNFNPPIGEQAAQLTHDEVVTLFHEFGHGLHHMLTEVEYLSASGINGVEWDAVELPSQFMENFCYEKEGLNRISGHFETGAPLPDDMREKLQAAKNFQSAMFMVRQLEFALFDFRIHSEFQPGQESKIQQTLNEVRQQVAVVIPPQWNRFQHSFSHIFAGGYSAGYYSYKWAEVLSADAFSRFEEEGIFSTSVGADFKESVLQRGGSAPAMELFQRFRGRKPDIEPLLRHSGIGSNNA
ncbi:oligopeptidase A [Pleionea sp. CnH1-48]|uniref:oligopeptidase A n=1 Tax=Pleionea sp. CnH1-48 TaxID=2954494 RepID=UPI0020972273|nr:oligopeptidase A [Pleionea sp. CnH1-48]MCO7226352.1 oligopeptidase A [Pleionea sp. CnH1-48]